MKLMLEIIFLVFLTIILYGHFSKSKENDKVEEINKRKITDDEFFILKEFHKKMIIYFVIECILFFILFVFILLFVLQDWNLESFANLFSGKEINIDIILEILILIIFATIIGCMANINYRIFNALKNKENIKVIEGFCVQTKSIVQKKNRRTVKYAVELTDAEDYSKIILNLRPEKDRFVIEKLINPNDRIFVFELDEDVYVMIKNTLFFKTDLYMEQLYKQKAAKEISKNITLNI